MQCYNILLYIYLSRTPITHFVQAKLNIVIISEFALIQTHLPSIRAAIALNIMYFCLPLFFSSSFFFGGGDSGFHLC